MVTSEKNWAVKNLPGENIQGKDIPVSKILEAYSGGQEKGII